MATAAARVIAKQSDKTMTEHTTTNNFAVLMLTSVWKKSCGATDVGAWAMLAMMQPSVMGGGVRRRRVVLPRLCRASLPCTPDVLAVWAEV